MQRDYSSWKRREEVVIRRGHCNYSLLVTPGKNVRSNTHSMIAKYDYFFRNRENVYVDNISSTDSVDVNQ